VHKFNNHHLVGERLRCHEFGKIQGVIQRAASGEIAAVDQHIACVDVGQAGVQGVGVGDEG
jgi:hypothetical protein